MKLNLDKQLLNLKGQPLENKLDEILADELAMSNVGRPAKMMAWAIKLMNDGEIEVDNDDLKFLKDFVENRSRLINLAKAQLLEEIDNLKE
jgi:hypothetical protein